MKEPKRYYVSTTVGFDVYATGKREARTILKQFIDDIEDKHSCNIADWCFHDVNGPDVMWVDMETGERKEGF